MDTADEADSGKRATRVARAGTHTTREHLQVSGSRWPVEAVSVLLVFAFLLAITVLGATVTTSRVNRQLNTAEEERDRARDRVERLDGEMAALTAERDMLLQRARDGATAMPLPVRVADHSPGTYVVGEQIAAGRWQPNQPVCAFVRTDLESGRTLSRGDAPDGVVLLVGEQVTFVAGECWWRLEGS